MSPFNRVKKLFFFYEDPSLLNNLTDPIICVDIFCNFMSKINNPIFCFITLNLMKFSSGIIWYNAYILWFNFLLIIFLPI